MKPRFVESETLSKAREMAVRLDALEKARACPKCDDGKLDKMGNCMKMGCGGPTKMQKASMSEKDKYCMKNFGKKYSECTAAQKAQCDKAHDKVEKASMADKDKYCMKRFGKKYSECTEKQKAECDKAHGKVEKAKDCPECGAKMEKGGCLKAGCGAMVKAVGEQMAEKITNVNPHFMTETGGQTRTAYYSTRDRPIETEDAKPKRKKADKKVDMEGLAGRMNPHEGTGVDREDSEGESLPLRKAFTVLRKSRDLRAAAARGAPTICRNCGATSASGCRVHNGMDMFACPGFEPMI